VLERLEVLDHLGLFVERDPTLWEWAGWVRSRGRRIREIQLVAKGRFPSWIIGRTVEPRRESITH
jgi:hypothetical protein